MSDGSNLICTFDSTFDGFLTLVHYTVTNRVRPCAIYTDGNVQTSLGCEILHIPTDYSNADLVRRTLTHNASFGIFKRAQLAFLASCDDSLMTTYTYILYALKHGKKLSDYRSLPAVNRAFALEYKVLHEADRMKGFLRFSVMEGGVQYAPMEPENDILVLLMPHFADRLKSIPFVIHDLLRHKVGVCKMGTWFISDATDLIPPPLSPEEKSYRELWKRFYGAVSIRERKNERLQTQMMPKKYRRHMTEHML